MKTLYLDIDGLDLLSGNYFFWVSNFGTLDRSVVLNDLYNNGASFNRSKTAERKFLLNGYCKTTAALNALKAKLYSGELKKLAVRTSGDDDTIYVMCDMNNLAEDNAVPGLISCQMVAPDPFKYALTPDTVSLGAESDASLTFPLTFPIVFGDITGASGVILNLGNAIAYPKVTIIGTCDSITVANTTTGESISCDISLGSDDVLIIDSRPSVRGIYLNDVKRMDLKDGSWLSCAIGENTFTFSRNSLETKQHCTIEMESRWM